MTDSYSGMFRPKEASIWRKQRQWHGVLMIEDDKLVFVYNNGNIIEIKYIEIEYIRPKTVIITLKDKREFMFYPHVGTTMVGFGTMEGNLDTMNQKARIVKKLNTTLNYLIKRDATKT